MSQQKRPVKCARCGVLPCICMSFCPSQRLGCCNSMNSSTWCAGPVNLTAEWDIGSRPCCKGAGEKYSAMGGVLNYCSTNGGKEYPNGARVLAPYPLTSTVDFPIPKNNPPPITNIRGNRFPNWEVKNSCEEYGNLDWREREKIKLPSSVSGIF